MRYIKKLSLLAFSVIFFYSNNSNAQYNMQNLTVFDCEGTLTDSEANLITTGYYNHNENFSFTICPPGALAITITFTFFETEPNFDYVRIFDGPDTNSPLIGGPFSGINLPPVVVSNGCITINFISDNNVAVEGFVLSWESDIVPPVNPIISLPISPTCSTDVLNLILDQNIHCDSILTALINVTGPINQSVNAIPINCVNDSTNTIQLNLVPGLNESGAYSIYFESSIKDVCDDFWTISSSYNFIINDCPLQVNLTTNNDSICIGDNTDIFVQVSGGDSTSYNYSWSPLLPANAGPHNVSPNVTTTYYVIVDDAGPAQTQIDSLTIYVLPLPIPQNDTTVCETSADFNLSATPPGGWWSGFAIINGGQGLFSPSFSGPGTHTVNYGYSGCSDTTHVIVLEIDAGSDISACPNAPIFNLNSALTTPGGTWGGCSCIQSNGNISVGPIPTTISAIYTLPNGCSDTLDVIIENIITQPDDTICQKSSDYQLTYSPVNGYWHKQPTLPQQSSSCTNSIILFPNVDNFESGLISWTQDPLNDFDLIVNSGGTPSGGTGPGSAYEGTNYIYTEASGSNNPFKRSGIISPCLNLSAYSNPILHFWYHMYDNPSNGLNQGTFSVDISTNNGTSWTNDIWTKSGSQGNQWLEATIDLSNYNSADVLIRLRIITGDSWQSDVAIDMLSILGGPITANGMFLSNAADSGLHTLIYTIQGCTDTVNMYVKPVDAGNDLDVCPTQTSFNLIGVPFGGIWIGTHITNPTSGLFNPSLGLGIDTVIYSVTGCTDTTLISVQETSVFLDSLYSCNDGVIISLDSVTILRIPTYGIWNGNGIISSNYPGEFDPTIAGVGAHTIYYSANSCVDSIIFYVAPSSILTDTMICATAANFLLNANPGGGQWTGQGIVNPNTGLFSPTTAGVGTHDILYQSTIGCLDTTTITVYSNPVLSMSGLIDNYCFLDTNIQVNVSPNGGILSGNGTNNMTLTFNPSLAGPGYHIITYSYGSGTCIISIDTIILVGDSLNINAYSSKDSICAGETTTIGINVSGGIGSNYNFNWDNGLGSSFEHNVSPVTSTNYNVIVSDGCSEPVSTPINIFVHPIFSVSFNTSSKQCYGEYGFAKATAIGNSNYSFLWDTSPVQSLDSIFDKVSRKYNVQITDNISGCIINDTVTIPGFRNIIASFSVNKDKCISLLDGTFQFIDYSNIIVNEISSASFWNFGDNHSKPYLNGENPFHTYLDTGTFIVHLVLINNGNCTDTASLKVCILPDKKIFVPNSFTPNHNHCNDEFFTKGVGVFYQFNIKIYKRWGGDIVFESDEIILTDSYSDGNFCNQQNYDVYSYYKMGTWDGKLENGTDAPMGVYAFIIEYKQLKNSEVETIIGTVTLIK